jgi:hypothetical protein
MELVYWMTCVKYLFINTLFPIGQLPSLEMCAISFCLSLFTLLQAYIRPCTVWMPLPQGHSGETVSLKRYRHDLVFPCAVTNAVKMEVRWIFIFNLSLMFGKNYFVTSPFVVLFNCCHFSMLFSISWYSTIFQFLGFCCNIRRCFWLPP